MIHYESTKQDCEVMREIPALIKLISSRSYVLSVDRYDITFGICHLMSIRDVLKLYLNIRIFRA